MNLGTNDNGDCEEGGGLIGIYGWGQIKVSNVTKRDGMQSKMN